MKQERRISRAVRVGGVQIGGGAPIPVQSMLNTPSHDFNAALAQTKRLADAGCDIVRLAVPDAESAEVFSCLRRQGITVPLVADIHFDYRLALECIKQGIDKIRINPGNIGSIDKIKLGHSSRKGPWTSPSVETKRQRLKGLKLSNFKY